MTINAMSRWASPQYYVDPMLPPNISSENERYALQHVENILEKRRVRCYDSVWNLGSKPQELIGNSLITSSTDYDGLRVDSRGKSPGKSRFRATKNLGGYGQLNSVIL